MTETHKPTTGMKTVINDKKTTLVHDFTPGHEYEVIVRAVGPDGTNEAMEIAARNTITITGKTAVPSPPTALTATGIIHAIKLSWTNPADYDVHRIQVWRSYTDNVYMALKIAEVDGITYTDQIGTGNATRYYWIRAVNTSEGVSDYHPSTVEGVSATTLGITATSIDDFAVTATKMFTKAIILTADAWTNNSPGAGSIAWNAHSVVYNGASYPITAGNTAAAYVYWVVGGTTYSTSATHPVLGTTGFMVAINTAGIHTMVWNSSANMVIGNAFIVDLLADKITAGTITGSTLQTAVSGQRVVIAVADNTLRFHTATETNVVTIDDNVSGTAPGMIVTSLNGGYVSVRTVGSLNNYAELASLSTGANVSTRTTAFTSGQFGRYRGSGSTYGVIRADKYLAGDSGPWISCVHLGEGSAVEFEVKDNGVADALGGYQVGSTTIIDSSRNLTNIGTVGCGAITSTGDLTLTAGSLEISDNQTLMHIFVYNGTTGPIQQQRHSRGSGVAGQDDDVLGEYRTVGWNDNATPVGTIFTRMLQIATDVSDGTEEGSFEFEVVTAGSLATALTVGGSGADVVGTVTASSGFVDGVSAGVDGTFGTDGNWDITVSGGIITLIAAG